MIVGDGLIARAFRQYYENDHDVILFASGGSNSSEKEGEPFARERNLLEQFLNQGELLVYFSTCSVDDPCASDSPYVRHKIAMENLIASISKNYAIFRLPQVVGFTPNPNTLTNYLNKQIQTGQTFRVWLNAKRNLIDVVDVAAIGSFLVESGEAIGRVTNIASPFPVAMPKLVCIFESILNKTASFDAVEIGSAYSINIELALKAAERLGIMFDGDYIEQIIRKYYGG